MTAVTFLMTYTTAALSKKAVVTRGPILECADRCFKQDFNVNPFP